MAKSKVKRVAQPKPLQRVTVNSLSQLETAHSEPIKVQLVNISGKQLLEVTGRRLKPCEMGVVTLWFERAKPKVISGAKEGDAPRLDLEEKDYPGGYPARAEHCRRVGRAVALWHAYDLFRQQAAEEQKDLSKATHEEIAAFVESRMLPDQVLQDLFAPVATDTVREFMSFISGSGFPIR